LAAIFRGPGTAFPRVPPYFNHCMLTSEVRCMARFNGLFYAVWNTDVRSKLKTSLNSTRVQWLDHYLFGVARSVGLSVCNDHQPGKTSEPIEVHHFGCGLRGRDYVLDDPKREGGFLREMTSRFPRTPPSTVPSGPATEAVECHSKFSPTKNLPVPMWPLVKIR